MIITDNSRPESSSEIIVELAKRALNNLPSYKTQQQYGMEQFRHEFGTVRLSLPRQSGHSTAALQLMYEYPDSLLFAFDGTSRNHLRMQLEQYTDDRQVRERIERNMMIPHHESLVRLPVMGRPFIIFDRASDMRKIVVDEIKASIDAQIILELG